MIVVTHDRRPVTVASFLIARHRFQSCLVTVLMIAEGCHRLRSPSPAMADGLPALILLMIALQQHPIDHHRYHAK